MANEFVAKNGLKVDVISEKTSGTGVTASGILLKSSIASFSGDIGIGRNAAGVLEINDGTAGALRDLTCRNLTISTGATIGGVSVVASSDARLKVTGFENRTDSTLGIASGVVSLTTSGSYNIWLSGVRTNKTTTQSVDLSASADGLWYVYFNTSAVLSASVDFPDLITNVIVAIVYKSSTNYLLADERHTIAMDAITHTDMHLCFGAQITAGSCGCVFSASPPVANFVGGTLWDEDLTTTLSSGNPKQVVVLWRRSGGAWQWTAAQNRFWLGTDTAIQVDDGDGTPAAVSNNNYAIFWVLATNITDANLIVIPGQAEYANITAARNAAFGDLSTGTLPTPEMRILYKVIMKQNSGSVTVEETQDYRERGAVAGGSATVNDHQTLANRGATDVHPYTSISSAAAAGSIIVSDGSALAARTAATVDVSGNLVLGGSATTATLTNTNTLTIQTSANNGNILLSPHGTGKVGIGNASPACLLHVGPTTYAGGSLTAWVNGAHNDISAIANNGTLYLETTDTYAINKGGSIVFGGNYGPSFTKFAGIRGGKESAVSGDYAGYMAFHTRVIGSTMTEKMRITSGGMVGIGTTTPDNWFAVAGTLYNSNFPFIASLMSTDAYAIDTGGAIAFGGKYASGGQSAIFSEIQGVKETAVDGNYAGAIRLMTRASSASSLTETLRVTSTGNVLAKPFRSYTMTRALPTAVNGYVEICSFDIANGAHNLRLSITTNDNGMSIAKQFGCVITYNATGSQYYEIIPMNSASLNTNDFALDMAVTNSTVYLRLRRTVGTWAATATINIDEVGKAGETFTERTGTGTVTSLPAFYWYYSGDVRGTSFEIKSATHTGELIVAAADRDFSADSNWVTQGGWVRDATNQVLTYNYATAAPTELIDTQANRDFSGATNWSGTNWAINSGTYKKTAGASNVATLAPAYLSNLMISGLTYRFGLDVTGTTAGTLVPGTSTKYMDGVYLRNIGNGTGYVFEFTNNSNNASLALYPISTFNGAVDNITLKIARDTLLWNTSWPTYSVRRNLNYKVQFTLSGIISKKVNRDFSGACDWSGTSWSLSGGTWYHTAGNSASAVLANANLMTGAIVAGMRYRMSFTLARASAAGVIVPNLGTAVGPACTTGRYQLEFTALENDADIIFAPTAEWQGSIDSIDLMVCGRELITSVNDRTFASAGNWSGVNWAIPSNLIALTANSDFSGAGNWAGTNWAVSGGTLLHTAGSVAHATLAYTNFAPTTATMVGKWYSITFTVTGRSAGTVLSAFNTNVIAAAANYNFGAAINWSGVNWARSSDTLLHTAGNTAAAVLTAAYCQPGSIIAGKWYTIVFTVLGCSAGTLTPGIGAVAGTAVNANGTYSQTLQCAVDGDSLSFTPSSDFNGAIDNLTVSAGLAVAANGTYSHDVYCYANDAGLVFAPSSDFDGAIDNVIFAGPMLTHTSGSAEPAILPTANMTASSVVIGKKYRLTFNNRYTTGSLTARLTKQLITAQVNRDFSGAGNWTGSGWTRGTNKLTAAAGAAAATLATANIQSSYIYICTRHLLVFTVSDYTAGSLTPSFGGVGTAVSGNGTYYQEIICTATSNELVFTPSPDFVGSITNIYLMPSTPTSSVLPFVTFAGSVDTMTTVDLTAAVSDADLIFFPTSDFNGWVDDVSLAEMTEDGVTPKLGMTAGQKVSMPGINVQYIRPTYDVYPHLIMSASPYFIGAIDNVSLMTVDEKVSIAADSTNLAIGMAPTTTPRFKVDASGPISIGNNVVGQLDGGFMVGKARVQESHFYPTNIGRHIHRLDAQSWGLAVGMSSDGRILCRYKADSAPPSISRDFGNTWEYPASCAPSFVRGGPQCVSHDGRVMILSCTYGVNALISFDYGYNWVYKYCGDGGTSSAVSGDGNILISGGYYAYISYDQGESWTSLGATNAHRLSSDGKIGVGLSGVVSGRAHVYENYFTTNRTYDFDFPLRGTTCSSNGKYMAIATTLGPIYFSSDYGCTWQAKGGKRAWTAVDMSGDGRVVVATAGQYQGGAGNTGYVYVSEDWGDTWQQTGFASTWAGVSLSNDARVMALTNQFSGCYMSYADSVSPNQVIIGKTSGLTSNAQFQVYARNGLEAAATDFVGSTFDCTTVHSGTMANLINVRMCAPLKSSTQTVTTATTLHLENPVIGGTYNYSLVSQGIVKVDNIIVAMNQSGSNYNHNIRLPANGTDYASIALGCSSSTHTGTGAGQWTMIRFPNTTWSYMFGLRYNATDMLTITSGGNVGIGIGTAAATQKLEIGGTAAQLYMNSATSNFVVWNTSGAAAPAFTTRSIGTKLVLYPAISGTLTDYAIGVDASTMWYSVPGATSAYHHKWYGATTLLGGWRGDGLLGVGALPTTFKLEVTANILDGAYSGLRIINTAAAGAGRPCLDFYNTNYAYTHGRIYSEVGGSFLNAKMYFDVADPARTLRTRMVIDQGGNIGIGTSTPVSLLQIAQPTFGPGTVTNSAGGTTVTGTSTLFLNTFKPGDTITIGGQSVTVVTIASNTSMTTTTITNDNTNATYTLVGGNRLSVYGNGIVAIGNDKWLAASDAAGTGLVNILKVNSSNEIEFGATLNLVGPISGPIDGGAVTLFDMPVVSAADNVEQSATIRIDANNVLKCSALATGSGTVDTIKVVTYGNFEPDTTNARSLGSATKGFTGLYLSDGTDEWLLTAGADGNLYLVKQT